MKLTNYLLLTVLAIVLAFYGFNEIGKVLIQSANNTAEQIRR